MYICICKKSANKVLYFIKFLVCILGEQREELKQKKKNLLGPNPKQCFPVAEGNILCTFSSTNHDRRKQ